ncbi:hypothetical protein OG302_37695 [Streptomyces sp. NBC_01283]|uniref:hypothetical protein n=1 Tax=Streptomyces sp. NBC_01283 TaxID=2903812 RepID=UPI00352E5DD4|nr:hypothetical protein OG302_37695 [Streptomyces sp. NBC_01283]
MAIRNKHRNRLTGAVLALTTGLVCTVSAQSAGADEPSDAGPAARHCVLDASTGERACFGTFTEAMDRATDGRVTDAPATPRAAATSSAFRAETEAEAKAGDVIQGTFFSDPGFSGDTLTISGPSLCEKDGWVNWQYDLGDDWKNRISSVQPWGNCAIWLYPEPDLGGDRDGPFDENTADVGQMMNDRTQSIGFS